MPKKRAFPSVELIKRLPVQLHMTVPPEWQDRNGHVNVQYYQTLYELGGYEVLREAGNLDDLVKTTGTGMFDLEHHICYLSEILVGNQVSTYNRILAVNNKRIHGMYFIVNDSRNRLASTIEYMTACVDLNARRTTVFPQQIYLVVKQRLESHEQLDWIAPVCGAMKL